MARELSPKAKRFAREYIIDLSGKEAAIRAGYSRSGAAVRAHKLLKDPRVAILVQKYTDERNERLEITADKVVQEIAKLAFTDIGDYLNEDGDMKPLEELTPAQRKGIQEISDVSYGSGDSKTTRRKFKLADKRSNLELLGRHMRMFVDKVEVGGDEDLVAALTAARQRVAKK